MKIVFLSDDFPPTSFGGAGISTFELAVGMKKAGHEVFVITTCRKDAEAGESEYHGLTVLKLASDYAPRWRAYISLYNRPVVRQVEQLLKEIKPDVVHANNIHYYLSYHSLKIAKRYARVVVFTARDAMTFNFGKLTTKKYLENMDCHTTWHDHIVQAQKGYNPFRNFCIKKYLKYTDKKFAVSYALQKALVQNGIKDVDVIHTGADVEQWCANEDEKNLFKKKYGLENKKVILFGGRLSEGKGGGKTLEAFVRIHKEVPDATLLVAGSIDAYADSMKEKARVLGIGDKLIITGWIERDVVRVAYEVADVVLVPSLCLDSFPRIVIEAMASRKPVVGTCYGGAPEIIVDGVTGYVVNPFYSEEIASKTIDLLRNPKKAEEFGSAGYERIKKDFNLEDKFKEYIVVYESLVRQTDHR